MTPSGRIALFIFMLIPASRSYSQPECLCSSFENISISSGWPKTYNVGADDDIWDLEAINADGDGVADDGFVFVGSSNSGPPNYMDIHMRRLSPAGATVVSANWPQTIDVQDKPDVAYALEQTTTGHLIVAGSVTTDKYNPGGSSKNVW